MERGRLTVKSGAKGKLHTCLFPKHSSSCALEERRVLQGVLQLHMQVRVWQQREVSRARVHWQTDLFSVFTFLEYMTLFSL